MYTRAEKRKGFDMRSDLTLGAAIQMAGYMTALATDQPDFITKVLGILAGCSFGALIAAAISDTPTTPQRIRRFIAAFGSGALASVVLLWIWPGRIGIDPREFVFVVSGIASCFAWRFVSKADSRADRVAERVADELEHRASDAIDRLAGKRENEGGKARLVVIVLLGALALWVWVFWDVFVLLWLLMTTQVH